MILQKASLLNNFPIPKVYPIGVAMFREQGCTGMLPDQSLLIMKYDALVRGKLIKRYMRFLADVEMDDGTIETVHCPNSGSMKSCLEAGAEVYCSPVNDPSRKTKFTWEMINIDGGWVGINTSRPNELAHDWLSNGVIPGFEMYTRFRREVKWEDSRFDVMAENDRERCFIEVKNVTLKEGEYALFPDAVTSRGKKHLETLVRVKKSGMRAVMLYMVQRTDVKRFGPAREIDPEYAEALDKAKRAGVEVIAIQTRVSPEGIQYAGPLVQD